MQKIDFIKNLGDIVEKLKSIEIIMQFNGGFQQPGQGFDYGMIKPLLFASKSNYDRIKDDPRYQEILNSLDAQKIFAEENLSALTTILIPTIAQAILTNEKTVSLYNFHNTIRSTYNLSKSVLQTSEVTESLTNEVANGVVVFQIMIEGQGLQTDQYIKIFTALSELVDTISKIFDEVDKKSEIILLDSGSDSNVGLKTGIETAKSLYLIFKEVWDFVTTYKYYKERQRNQTLLDSLTVRAEIKRRIEEKVISEEEGQIHLHMIKTRTEDLIGMKVLPKQIAIESTTTENKRLLSEFEGLKLLSSGDNKAE